MKLKIKVSKLYTPKIDEVECQFQELKEKYPDKKYTPRHVYGEIIIKYLRVMEAFLYKYNAWKEMMDSAADAKDIEKFELALSKIKNLAFKTPDGEILMGARRRLKQTKHWWKVQTPYREYLLHNLAGIYDNTIKGGELWLKRNKLTPAQQIQREKASERMRNRWSE